MRSSRDVNGVAGTAGARAVAFVSLRAEVLRVLAGLEKTAGFGAVAFSSFSAMVFLEAEVSSFQ